MDDIQQMVVVDSKYLDEEIVVTSSIMALHHFRNLLEGFYCHVEFLRILQIDAHISTCLIPDTLRVDDKA